MAAADLVGLVMAGVEAVEAAEGAVINAAADQQAQQDEIDELNSLYDALWDSARTSPGAGAVRWGSAAGSTPRVTSTQSPDLKSRV